MRIAIEVQGMSCGGCVVAVRNVLSRLPGVGNVEVEVGRVTLELDEAQATEQRIREAITRAGFEAKAFQPA
jgi:copper chaperone